jgi:hypothetical protein
MLGFDRITLGSTGAGRTRLQSRHADHSSVERLRRDDGCCQTRDGHLYLVYHQLYSYSRSQCRTNGRDAYRQLNGTSSASDWIGLDAIGDPNTSYLGYRYTNGAPSGSITFTAPATLGTCECRYLLKPAIPALLPATPSR